MMDAPRAEFGARLLLAAAASAEVARHAREAWPRECCGFLVGWPGSPRQVRQAVRLANLREGSAVASFEIDPLDWVRVERDLEAPLAVVGIYHSHPGGPCLPSAWDAAQAHPGLSYLIVASHEAGCGEMRSWAIDEDGMLREESLEEVA